MVSAGRLDGRIALVTAAASGIGAASATRLAAEGATVVLTDVADDQGRDLAARLAGGTAEGAAGGAVYQHLDVGVDVDWALLRAFIDDRYGRLDIVHSNAAYVVDKAAHELTLDEWNAQLAVSLTGAWLMVRTFIDLLRAARGSIILTSSGPGPGRAASPARLRGVQGSVGCAGPAAGRRVRAGGAGEHDSARADPDPGLGRGLLWPGRRGTQCSRDGGRPAR